MNGKVLVAQQILKCKNRAFKGAEIVMATGLSRQLVYKHLSNMHDEGLLSKVGTKYKVEDEEGIIDSLIANSDTDNRGLMDPNLKLIESQVYNDLAEVIVAMRALEVEPHKEFKEVYVEAIDDCVKELKRLRKFLNAGQRSPRSAARVLNRYEEWTNLHNTMQALGWEGETSADTLSTNISEGLDEVL